MFLGYDEDGKAVFLGSDGHIVLRSDDGFNSEREDNGQLQLNAAAGRGPVAGERTRSPNS